MRGSRPRRRRLGVCSFAARAKGCSSPISRFWSLGRFAADVGSDVFAAASYALTCALFRVACALTLLRLNSLFVMIQNLGVEHGDGGEDDDDDDDDDDVDNEEDDVDDVDRSDVGAIVEEHAALRALVRRMAHSFRMFLVVTTLACLGECFAASLYAVSVHADVLSDGDRRDLTRALGSAVPSALRLLTHAWGTALNLRAATLATHRMQKTGSYLSERHARITAQLCAASDPRVHERGRSRAGGRSLRGEARRGGFVPRQRARHFRVWLRVGQRIFADVSRGARGARALRRREGPHRGISPMKHDERTNRRG